MTHVTVAVIWRELGGFINIHSNFLEDAIANAVSTSVGILGREQQSYIVGSGVTARGAKLLAQKLACMTIGDLDALLQLKNIDPLKVALLLGKIQDLAKALVNVFVKLTSIIIILFIDKIVLFLFKQLNCFV